MTDNDYIAEYVKEKFPKILGFNFFAWKMGSIVRNGVHSLIESVESIGVSETCDDTEDDEDDDEIEMTQEEALSILDTIPTIGRQVDALEMAIKALKGGEQE